VPGAWSGSLFSPPPREDPLAERRHGGGSGPVGGFGGAGSNGGSGSLIPGRKGDLGAGAGNADDRELPAVSAGLRVASVQTGTRGIQLDALRDGASVCIELRGAGSGGGEGWSEGFLCVHPHKTYETAAMMGTLNWGGHQITVASRASVEAICRGESVVIGGGGGGEEGGGVGPGRGGASLGLSGGGGPSGDRVGRVSRSGSANMFVTPEEHEREANRFLFRLHLFGCGRDITLRSEATGTLVTTFLYGVHFERRRVVAWHRQRSSKVLTAGVSMLTPPEGGAWEEFALSPVVRSPMGLVPAPKEDEATAAEFVVCRPRDGTYWSYNGGGDDMLALTRELSEASLFRLHPAHVDPITSSKWE